MNQKIGIIVKTINRDYPIFKIEILRNNTKSNGFLYRERNISISLLKGRCQIEAFSKIKPAGAFVKVDP